MGVTIQCQTVQFQHIQAIVLDKDGTLANAQEFLRNLGHKRARLIDAQIPGVQEPLLMAFGLEGQQLNPAGLLAVGTRQENEIAAAAYVAETGRDWLASLSLVRSAFEEADHVFSRKADHTPLFEEARHLLQTLAAGGHLKLGILSSDSTANVRDFVQKYQLQPYVQVQVGTEAGQVAKPNPEVLHQVCQQLGVAPAATLVIGDTDMDIAMAQAAQAAGCIGVTWGGTSLRQLERANATIARADQLQVLPEI